MDILTREKRIENSPDVSSVLAGLAQSQPDNAAILAPGRAALTYALLRDQQDYVLGALSGWGVNRGDVIAVILPNGPEMTAAIAVLPVSATAFPMDPNLSVDDYETLFQRCSAKGLILPQGQTHVAREAANRAGLLQIDLISDLNAPAGKFTLSVANDWNDDRDINNHGRDIAYILSTSGTTSQRKLVPVPHQHIVTEADEVKRWYGWDSTDLSIQLAPLHSAAGVKAISMWPLLSGVSMVSPPSYEARNFFQQLDEFKPTWLSTGFTYYRDILRYVDDYKEIVDATQFRFLRASSGRLEPDEIVRLEQAFKTPVIVGLSATECGWITANPLPPQARKIDSVGVPTGNEVCIRDTDGRFVGVGEEGEIVVRGPLMFDGYLDDSEATENAFVDGWYRTGDIGKFDEDGFLFLAGRIKEVINRGGEKISPVEIDKILERHPSISEAAAFGWPHPTLGEVAVAAVVLAPGANPSERDIMAHVRDHLANSKLPAKIFFVEALPRTGTGKLQRSKLRELVS